MADKKPHDAPEHHDKFMVSVNKTINSLDSDFFKQHSSKLTVVLIVIILAIGGIIVKKNADKSRMVTETELLGKAYNYTYINKTDSARITLESAFEASLLSGISASKGALLLANIYYNAGELEKARQKYEQTLKQAGKSDLLRSAAEHGLASILIQEKKYDEAVSSLQAFVKKWGNRTGNPEERYAKTEKGDKVATIPDALWKIALCQAELGQKEDARTTTQKILKIYPRSREAVNARKLMASL
jgi:predicted negative regulator of RcsB-dependent stress response